MPKRSTSQQVPKEMQARFGEVTQLTDTFCQIYLLIFGSVLGATANGDADNAFITLRPYPVGTREGEATQPG
jgi:hypothetical protein